MTLNPLHNLPVNCLTGRQIISVDFYLRCFATFLLASLTHPPHTERLLATTIPCMLHATCMIFGDSHIFGFDLRIIQKGCRLADSIFTDLSIEFVRVN